jgi:hypothetical protein
MSAQVLVQFAAVFVHGLQNAMVERTADDRATCRVLRSFPPADPGGPPTATASCRGWQCRPRGAPPVAPGFAVHRPISKTALPSMRAHHFPMKNGCRPTPNAGPQASAVRPRPAGGSPVRCFRAGQGLQGNFGVAMAKLFVGGRLQPPGACDRNAGRTTAPAKFHGQGRSCCSRSAEAASVSAYRRTPAVGRLACAAAVGRLRSAA